MRSSRRRSERGQGLVEYALILVLVAVVAIVILAVAGQSVANVFCDVVIQLGTKTSDSIAACAAPRFTISGVSNGAVIGQDAKIEAIVHDNKGDTEPNITHVEFWLDGVKKQDEQHYTFCMGGGDAPAGCSDYHFGSGGTGSHTLRVVVKDADGNQSESTITFTVS